MAYRSSNGTDYFMVGWEDGSSSWTKLGCLSCKDKIVVFLKKCMMIQKENFEREAKLKRKKIEEDILKQIIHQNTKVATASEIEVQSNTGNKNILRQEPSNINIKDIPFSGIIKDNFKSLASFENADKKF